MTKKGFVHRDLAARNVLLNESMICKVRMSIFHSCNSTFVPLIKDMLCIVVVLVLARLCKLVFQNWSHTPNMHVLDW